MFNFKEVLSAVEQVSQEKGLPKEKIISVLENALAAAYKKEYRKKSEIVKSKLDTETGNVKFWQVKLVLDESMIREDDEEISESQENSEEGLKKVKFNSDRHIMLEEAKKIDPKIKAGDELVSELPAPEKEFGRIAAQTAKQVVIQRLREVERETIYESFKEKEGEIVSGLVQRVEGRNVFVDLGKAIGLMPSFETILSEHYRPGQRLRFYLNAVEFDARGPKVYLSRAHPKFISKLFSLEVPEIQEGIVEIKGIVREPGSRTKIAVYSNQEGIDAVGSCVGQRGSRVMTVLNEVSPEKIDIVEWSEDIDQYVANSLAPAKVKEVKLLPKREVLVLVNPDQLSLAIGKEGQNVRLAAKLTGLKIDVRSVEEPEKIVEGGVAEVSLESGEDEAGDDEINNESKKEEGIEDGNENQEEKKVGESGNEESEEDGEENEKKNGTKSENENEEESESESEREDEDKK